MAKKKKETRFSSFLLLRTFIYLLKLNYLRCNCAGGMHEKRESTVETKIKRVIFFTRREKAARRRESLNESDRLVKTTVRAENVSVTMHFAAYCTYTHIINIYIYIDMGMRWKIYFASFRKDPRITM